MLKSTGIVRKIDDLGRIVLPVELRKKLSIEIGTPIEIYTCESKIILEKYKPRICRKCGQTLDENINYCSNCGKKVEDDG